MFIYILNLLNDSLNKKSNINERSEKEESEVVLSSIINNTYEKREKERRRQKNMSLEEFKNVG